MEKIPVLDRKSQLNLERLLKFLNEKRDVRILLARTDRIGDVVLSIPLIKILKKRFPSSYIGFMVRPYTKDLLEGNPYLDKVLVYDKYNRHHSLKGSLEFLKTLKRERFDLSLILHPTNRAHILCFLARIPFRIGYDIKMGFLNNIILPHTKQEGKMHELEYNLQFLKLLEMQTDEIDFFIPLKKEEEALHILEKNRLLNKKIIFVNPTASCISKIWPPEYFASLINSIKSAFPQYHIILVGLSDKKELLERLKHNLKFEVLDLVGKTDLSLLASLLKRGFLFISCDSGPVHIASSLGIRCVVIFGRKQKGLSPQRWKPWGKRHIILHKDVGCKECLAHNCKNDFLCLKSIKPQEVFDKIKDILGKEEKDE